VRALSPTIGLGVPNTHGPEPASEDHCCVALWVTCTGAGADSSAAGTVCSYQLGLAQDMSSFVFGSLKISLSFLAPQHLDTGGLGLS